jgi:hypothetical protein
MLFERAIAPGNGTRIEIRSYSDDLEVRAFARKVKSVFERAGWHIGYQEGRGTGWGFRILSANTETPEATKIATALSEVGQPFYKYTKRVENAAKNLELEVQIGERMP